MNLKRLRLRLEDLQLLNAIVISIWIANTALIWYLLTKIDSIVNVQLYSYGLQFNYVWANQYGAILRLMFLFLALSTALGLFVLSLGIIRMRKPAEDTDLQTKTISQEPQETKETQETPKMTLDLKQTTMKGSIAEKKQKTKHPQEASELEKTKDLITHCPNCGKVTDRPLVKLDFSGDKIQLVSACPYCNHVIGEISTKRDNPATDETQTGKPQ